MICPVCQQEIEPGSPTCPKCGAQLVPTLSDAQRKGGWRVTVALFVISVVAMGIFAALVLSWHEEQQRTMLLEQQVAIEAELGHGETEAMGHQEGMIPLETDPLPTE